jgi:hypothetical protein
MLQFVIAASCTAFVPRDRLTQAPLPANREITVKFVSLSVSDADEVCDRMLPAASVAPFTSELVIVSVDAPLMSISPVPTVVVTECKVSLSKDTCDESVADSRAVPLKFSETSADTDVSDTSPEALTTRSEYETETTLLCTPSEQESTVNTALVQLNKQVRPVPRDDGNLKQKF